jgi:Tetracyclin repressor-like, C-terminal domain
MPTAKRPGRRPGDNRTRAAILAAARTQFAELCAAHLVGLGITRYIVFIEPLASLPPDAVADLVAPAMQRYMTGRLPHP